MKKLLLALVLAFGMAFAVNAQNYSAGSYYSQQTYIQDICNGCYCQHAVWHSAQGTHWVYVWNGYQWVYVQQYGWYYWYTWQNYIHPSCR